MCTMDETGLHLCGDREHVHVGVDPAKSEDDVTHMVITVRVTTPDERVLIHVVNPRKAEESPTHTPYVCHICEGRGCRVCW